ncbi:MAG: phosphatase PAP2 family protein [Caldilineales bacterium]|nr:phosphatase PAP2 family protein [Caldilineales bacterium]MDW8319420.1 phosphatase PAP2 family protein [Anaerolineae bacterium]
MDQLLQTWGIDFIVWVQSFANPLLDRFFLAITWLGTIYGYLVLLPLIYWSINRSAGRRLFFLVMTSVLVSAFFKNLFRVPRPDPSLVRQPEPETSFSFPSDHAQTGGVVFWGFLASRVRRGWFTAVAVVMAFLLGFSRIYLGVHRPQEVVAGWLIGLALLWLFLRWEPRLVQRWQRLGLGPQVAVAVLLPLLPLFLVPSDENGHYPAEVAGRVAGILIGGGLGSILESRTVRFRSDGAWWRRLLRYALGMPLVLAVFLAGSAVPDLSPWALDTAVRVLRYAVLGLVAFWLAPWLFVKLRLADAEKT